MHDDARSPVPDLLFEDQQEARVADLGNLLETPERVSSQDPLHRLTVFLTYRCNLACPYCKTIARSEAELEARPQKRNSYDLASFKRLLDSHAGTPIRHLHFTGGEAATVRGLSGMIRLAKERGVEAVSLTSNGTLPARLYLELVASGLDELRISLDAAAPGLGAELTQSPRAFGATVQTLEELATARREGTRFFLIINSVVGRENRAVLPELLRFVLRFSPDDVKLITEVDQRGFLSHFPEASAVRSALDAILREHAPDRLPLLRRKLETVFASHAIGLEQEPRGRQRWRCYIPLTERTVDSDSYYPCSVYLREGKAPLGPLSDSPDVQRAKSQERRLRPRLGLPRGSDLPAVLPALHPRLQRARQQDTGRRGPGMTRTSARVELPEPTEEELSELAQWLDALAADAAGRPRASGAYLVITPLGLPHAGAIEQALKRLRLAAGERWAIPTDAWPRFDTAVHVRAGAQRPQLRQAALYEQLWSRLFPDAGGEVWELPANALEVFAGHKASLRRRLPSLTVEVAPHVLVGELHPFHLADPSDCEREARRMRDAGKLLGIDG